MTTNRQIEASTTIVGEDGYSYRCTVFLDLGTPFDFARGSLDIVQCMTAVQLRMRAREARYIRALHEGPRMVPVSGFACDNIFGYVWHPVLDARLSISPPRYFK